MTHLCRFLVVWAVALTIPMNIAARDIKVQVAATSDVHARLFPYNFIQNKPAATSLANVHYLVQAMRAREGTNLILLDNGDLLQGTPAAWYANFEQEADQNLFSRVMNFVGYDAATIGNHDIETGPDVYNRLKEEFDFPLLGANVLDAETGEPYFIPYTIIERQRVRIAVLGLSTTGVPNWLPPHLWEGLAFQDMAEAAAYWVKHIQENENPDAIVGLFHSGLGPFDAAPGDHPLENASGYVAKHVPGFNLIFTAHDHRERVQTIINVDGEEVLILGPGHFAENLAIAEFSFSRLSRNNFELQDIRADMIRTEALVPSHTYIRNFEDDVQEILKFSNEEIGKITEPMHSIESLFGSAPFTDMVHDIQLMITDADVSFTAQLAFDETINAGTLRRRDFFKLYEFENYLYTMELTGREIHDFLEFSALLWFNHMQSADDHLLNMHRDQFGRVPAERRGWRALRNPSFNFDSAAGIIYVIDVSEPPGARVTIKGFEDGRPFDEDSFYKVAINSYRGSGGGGHLTEGAGIAHEKLGERIIATTDTDLRKKMIDFFKETGAYKPQKRGNWHIEPKEWVDKGREKDMQYLR
jgi:2',3'-cyclic-nucleotide 2'-phosphodiesterase / 3'-nucleotidase